MLHRKTWHFIEASTTSCIGTQKRFTAPKVGTHVWIPIFNVPTSFLIGKVYKDIVLVTKVTPLDLE